MSIGKNRVIISDHLDDFNEINEAPGEVSILDLDQVYHHVTPLQDRVLGYGQDNKSLIGKTNFDIQAPAIELAPQFHQEVQKVIDTQTSMLFFCSGKFAKDEVINYVYAMIPIQTPDGNSLGLMVQGERLNNHCDAMQAIQHLYSKMDKHSNYKTFLFAPTYPGLTKKESQCLYWMLRGYSASQISQTLYLSPRTVETHINNIKIKYGCASKQELHDYCYHSGLIQILPTID